ncbi:MAG: hypothetical protein F6J93_31860 [Oscillatoria sp. SIO1A7]|nr:hypothetical protein [Oscillatoria sp. SIO1A7]
MSDKLRFYQTHGVEEYYIYDPERVKLTGYKRDGGKLKPIKQMNGWTSPLLGIRFEMTEESLELYDPQGERFLTSVELKQQIRQAKEENRQLQEQLQQTQERAEQFEERANKAEERANKAEEQASEAIARIQATEEILRQQGINREHFNESTLPPRPLGVSPASARGWRGYTNKALFGLPIAKVKCSQLISTNRN